MAHPNRTVSPVLGSGGARGLAHIGVIDYLVKNPIGSFFFRYLSRRALPPGRPS